MGYWRKIFGRAWRDARRATKTDTYEAIFVTVLSQGVIAALLFYLTNDADPWVRVVTVSAPFAVTPLVFGFKLVAAPKALYEEKEQELAVLRRQADEKDRKRAAKDALGALMAEGRNLSQDCSERDVEADAMAWATRCRDLIRETFGSGEAELFLDDSGYMFFSGGLRRDKVQNFLVGRTRRLGELMARADHLVLRAHIGAPSSDRD